MNWFKEFFGIGMECKKCHERVKMIVLSVKYNLRRNTLTDYKCPKCGYTHTYFEADH